MDVSVESSAPVPSPLGPSFPSSPTNSRKRTFDEVHNDDGAEARKIQRSDQEENQENWAPSEHDQATVEKPAPTDICPPASTVMPENNKDGHPPPSSPRAEQKKEGSENSALATLSAADTNMPVPTPSTPQHSAASSANNPAKKRKLSPASKEAKRLEKEEKERLKQEEKARKEEEKRIKEEERKKREAEREEERKKREEKRKQKEEEKMAKEEEKRRKEEEKLKKERAQMKLSAFFTKPTTTTTAVSSSNAESSTGEAAGSTSADKEPEKVLSDYEKEFPEFFVQSHTKLAPQHRFERDLEATEHICRKLDALLKGNVEGLPVPHSFRGSEMFKIIPYRRRRGRNVMPVKEIITKIQNYVNTIDLTGESSKTQNPMELLKKVTMKTLKFGEDVRPPYQGTFTKPLPAATAVKLCKKPNSRALPDTNYDYDSEAEWEEPEEGEDLDSEGEEEISEDGDDDMEGFLDDSEDPQVDGRRRLIVGDLEPVCTGIRWQEDSESDPEMQAYRMEIISDTVRYPIDPFSTAYWPKPKAVEQAAAKGSLAAPGTSARTTLHAYSTNPQSSLAPPTHSLASTEAATSGKAKRAFPPEQLDEFKQVVEGSDLTKTGLIEVLKKRFPKVSKDVLKDTLHQVAERVGQKESEKKWVCK